MENLTLFCLNVYELRVHRKMTINLVKTLTKIESDKMVKIEKIWNKNHSKSITQKGGNNHRNKFISNRSI